MSGLWLIIPVHSRADITEACLVALEGQRDRDFEVVVVDDGSTDRTPEMLRTHAWVRVLTGDGSLWWTGATNLGVTFALDHGADAILTLNDDTVPGPEFVERMKAHHRELPDALIGALQTDVEDDSVVYAGETIDWARARYIPLATDVPPSQRYGLHPVTHFPGRGLLVPRVVFERIGLYDRERFPQAVADYDFTHRAFAAGFMILCAWDVVLPSRPAESGGVALKQQFSWGNYHKHLFGMKGAGNLRTFAVYGWRNSPARFRLQFVMIGMARRAGGYLRDWMRSGRKSARTGAQQ